MLLIVGNRGGTNVAQSLSRAAEDLAFPCSLLDARGAQSSFRLVNALAWRLLNRRPAQMSAFGNTLIDRAKHEQATLLLTTGLCPVSKDVLLALKQFGVLCMHYSTDDPWNPGQRAEWFMQTLPLYDVIFTPRTRNIADFVGLGCKTVRYLPFGYDESIFGSEHVTLPSSAQTSEVLFVGGADRDRFNFIEVLLSEGIPMALVGGYWDRYPSVKAHALGHKSPDELSALTRAAKVNLCLVRRANRDGHVMRSFEMAALGACMVVEDTEEHRDIFGPEGECVVYFSDPHQAAAKIRLLLSQPTKRNRLSRAVQAKITTSNHTYTHRLQSMLQSAQEFASSRLRHPSA